MNYEQIVSIVEDLNIDLYVKTGIGWTGFSVTSNGFTVIVEFLGERVWSDDDDQRKYNDLTDEYEDLKAYLVKEAKNLVSLYSEHL